jgi:hypothetical protein
MPNKLNQWRNEKAYRAKLNLLAKIKKQVAPELDAMRKADDLLERCTVASLGIEKQGYSCLVGDKYNGHVYSMGTMESDLASANDSFSPLLNGSMEKAREHTQTTAGGMNSQG